MSESIVILWWEQEIRVLDRSEEIVGCSLEDGDDPVAAISGLLARHCPGERAARLVYHPSGIDAHSVPCPAAGRRRIRRALAGRFPELNEPGAVWSAEPARPAPEGCATVLYLDRGRALPRLTACLGARGVRLEAAWPLLRVIEELPELDGGGRGFGVLAAAGKSAVVSSIDAAGGRLIRFASGPDPLDPVAAALATLSARFDEAARPPIAAIVEEGPRAASLKALLPPGTIEIPLRAWLGQARLLAPGGVSDFLPADGGRGRADALRFAAAAAGALLLAGAAWLAAANRLDRSRLLNQEAAERARQDRWHLLVEARSGLQSRMDRLRNDIGQLECPPQFAGRLLETLARAAPKALVVRSFAIDGDRFTIRGRIAGPGGPAAADDPLRQLDRTMASPGSPWRWTAEPDSAAGTAFVRRGLLCPESLASRAAPQA